MKHRSNLISIIVLTIIYIIFAKLGLSLAITHKNVTLIWPPTGLAIAVLVLNGSKLWPAITLGAFVTNYMLGTSLITTLVISCGNTLEALVAYYLLRRNKFDDHFSNVRTVIKFFVYAVICATLVSAFFGAMSLWLFEGVESNKAFKVFLDWWLGDALGAFVIAPLLLVWNRENPLVLFKDKVYLLLSILLVTSSYLAFSGWYSQKFGLYLLLFFPIPVLVAMAFRYQIKGAALGVFILTASSVLSIFNTGGDLPEAHVHYQLVLLFSFLSSSGVISFLCAAAIEEQKKHEKIVGSIFHSTATFTGVDYLNNLIKNLSEVLDTKYAFIGEILEDKKSVKTISVFGHGGFQDNFVYSLEHTPCDNVMREDLCSYPKNIQQLFPKDHLLVEMQAESYIGALLFNSEKQPMGILAVVDIKEITDDKTASSILKIFAQRAGAELERKNNDSILLEAKETAESSNKAKDEFLAVMSHELRTPMNVIMGMSDALSEEIEDETHLKYLAIQNKAANGLLELISDILDVSKIERGILAKNESHFNPLLLLESIIDLFDPYRENDHLTLSVKEGLPKCFYGDQQRLRQILINLVGNAIKFASDGNVEILVEFERETDDQGKLKINVVDDGIGIPEEKLSEILKPFTQVDSSNTRKYGGSGLGLSIVSKLVDWLGGELNVESQIGKGSNFSFWVPLSYLDKEVEMEMTVLELDQLENEPKRLLLAEDSEDNVELIKLYLKGTSYDLDIARNGQEAYDMVCGHDYDLVLMDVQMPILDGIEATKRIRAREVTEKKKKTFVFALTANAMEEDIQASHGLGFDQYITKPIKKADFLFRLYSHFKSH